MPVQLGSSLMPPGTTEDHEEGSRDKERNHVTILLHGVQAWLNVISSKTMYKRRGQAFGRKPWSETQRGKSAV